MSMKNNYFKIGLFTFAGLALLILGLLAFGLSESLFNNSVECVTFFSRSVQGLSADSAVKFRGFRVGKVRSISLASVSETKGQPVVKVVFEIDPNLLAGQKEDDEVARNYIIEQTERGLTVVLSFQGVTGIGFLDLDYSTDETPPKQGQNFERLRQISAQYGLVFIPSAPGQIMEISESASQIVKSLSAVDFKGFSDNLNKLVSTVDKAVTDLNTAQISKNTNGAMVEIRAAAAEMTNLLVDLGDTVRGGANSQIAKELEETSKQLRVTMKRFDQLFSSSQGSLPMTLANLRVMSENFREMSELLRDQPSQALFGAPPQTFRPSNVNR